MGKENEKLVVKSKLNPIKNTLVVESDVMGSKNTGKEKEIQELARQGVCDIKPCCCDECYPCPYERIVEARKLAEVKKLEKPKKKPSPCE